MSFKSIRKSISDYFSNLGKPDQKSMLHLSDAPTAPAAAAPAAPAAPAPETPKTP